MVLKSTSKGIVIKVCVPIKLLCIIVNIHEVVGNGFKFIFNSCEFVVAKLDSNKVKFKIQLKNYANKSIKIYISITF
jgi:hypothetical protein